jgi:plastocyanin
VLAVLAGALLLGACGSGDTGGAVGDGDGAPASTTEAAPTTEPGPSGPVGATITLQPTTFNPDNVTIKPGEAVLWKWGGGVQHDVKGDGFESKLQSKGTFQHTFDTAGSYPFKCEVHPTTMKGTVTVAA